MTSFATLACIVGIFLCLTRFEYRRHQQRIAAIPHRIHINGTRGKSSVTRLIGAGLRAGGMRALTKVTGTFPRMILTDGTEVPIHRKAAPSILEQIAIVDFAVRRQAEALVIECMALEPEYQRITEQQMIHATVGVMTNVRLDHTEVMGRTLPEIGVAMANTMPRQGLVLTGDQENPDLIQRLAEQRGARFVAVGADAARRQDMDGFRYIEHRENVALALTVCSEL